MSETGAHGLDLHRYARMEEDEEAVEFEEALLERFAESEEARPILEQHGEVGWAGLFMQSARWYEGYYLPLMGPGDVRFVLLRTFPRKVSCEPSAAGEIVEELRAFYAFLGRELSFQHAAACLASLSDELTHEMERELANPANFGMAKSFFMGGSIGGLDRPREGGSAGPRLAPPAATGGPVLGSGARRRAPVTKAERNKKKAQRRAERDARRKSR